MPVEPETAKVLEFLEYYQGNLKITDLQKFISKFLKDEIQ